MNHVVPKFSNEKIAKIVKIHYGLEGEISSFVSYEDQNAQIKTSEGTFVLKISNQVWAQDFVEMQTDVLIHLENNAPSLTLPSVIKTLSGETMINVDGFNVRLLSFLEGELLTNVKRTPVLYKDIGRFLGQFSKGMEGYDHPGRDGSDPYWKLDNVLACRDFLPEVIDEDARDRVGRLLDYYEANILPRLQNFRKAIIHGDANEQNFLISPDEPEKIAGLIDFGEMQYGCQINELAISMAYCLLDEDDIDTAMKNMIAGYEAEFPLLEEERDVLVHLIAMRLVTNITNTSHAYKMQPDNDYILVAQGPAKTLLKRFEDENYIMN